MTGVGRWVSAECVSVPLAPACECAKRSRRVCVSQASITPHAPRSRRVRPPCSSVLATMELRRPLLWLWCASCFCVGTVLMTVRDGCPENALEKAMKCTAGLGIGPPFISNAFIERGQIQFAKDACRDRTLHDAISCLEKILEACQGNSDREHFLQNMIDTKKSRDVVDFFCSNIHVYENHAPCIASRHSALTQCLESQQKTMQTKVKATSNMDFLMTSNCKYFQAADVCSRRVLGENCGQEALGMVVRVFSGFKPPICDVSSGGDSQPDYEGQQSGKRPVTGQGTSKSSKNFFRLHLLLLLLLYNGLTRNIC